MTTSTDQASAVRYDKDADGIVTLTLDDPEASANTMNERYSAAMGEALDRLEREVADGDVKGVVVTSAKKTFFAGGDLHALQQVQPEDAGRFFAEVEGIKGQLRRLEQIGRPVVAAINGTALGGGLEIALACHHRIAVDDRGTKIGFPEVTLGLLPGGGGVTRSVRMLGLQDALMNWLLQGQQRAPQEAKDKGLVDEVVASQDELLPAARAWVLAHADDDEVGQPWDRKGYKLPGGTPSNPKLAAFLPAFPANLRKQLKGAAYPAPRAILSAAVEGAQVDVDTASRIESRWFTSLATGPTAKSMIQAFFFDLQEISSGALRPDGIDKTTVDRVGVLGAGMMGAGIAYACATRGIDVVLKDVSAEAAEKGKSYTAKLLDKKVEKGRMTAEAREEILGRITPTTDAADLAGCDAVIEAVFEDAGLKAKVFAEAEEQLPDTALLCSNTSTLPITELAENVSRPRDFIGLHFFSPVDKMKLVEIIKGKETSDEALARAIDVVQQIGKIPIVVNDSRGFYTSRVFGTLITEGVALVEEGVDPATIERAATMAGFPAPPLAMLDEVSLTLTQHIRGEAEKAAAAAGQQLPEQPGSAVVDRMVGEFGRKGRAAGAGFYDYPDDGPKVFWPGVREHFTKADVDIPLRDIQDRYLFAMALETAKTFEEGVIESAAAANIGSIFGIGFPPLTGGAVQFMQGYPGGLAGFVTRARELAKAYGPRFEPSEWLVAKAESGERF
ncbi:3-hydroxyacyl-CoA dehydrogenase/enoyl-CoA hydratase/3-hydroxybutyryl-CoA epimerase [Barrientosiimonas humi]|uniref:3-hydroxyacyl-CoA dehydrogenase/enoyl-CoA hydratase/3-hydroxybutyryl-CoA epimerase n=1 Tax=Barrientosiimonas humi TaxID=999931 RepID=A0A542X8H1_9MICO|nr:3-hydroxyacyl-CoA dehydrogenase NAD-binding domain-containing protein [Barrientosiimonas humi]TQL32138.1 3-hydroxyacyl-CoA dehydrogenase/enoyl-CoA hydratase/3-hydroxybutyryl-CoA epimerase [Barrientosiimonas humi]CAG7572126.1 Fatty acid oxidation complex subunit alpha [Barrientosiimonas humi]